MIGKVRIWVSWKCHSHRPHETDGQPAGDLQSLEEHNSHFCSCFQAEFCCIETTWN